VVTVVYKIESEIWGSLPPKIWRPKKFGRPKILKFWRDFGLCNLIANISGWEQDVVDRKTALQATITPVYVYQIWWTFVHKRRKIGPAFRPSQSTFSDAHISGANGRCPLKISGWPMLANAHPIGDVVDRPIPKSKRIIEIGPHLPKLS